MIRAALITLALTAPASAATVNDLTMTLIDGRPVFRPADGLDCWTAKFGGIAIDCALADADLTRPRRAPCWLRDYPGRVCPMGSVVLAALPAAPSVLALAPAHGTGRPGWTGGNGSCCGGHRPDDPPHVAPVPLPAGGALLLAALLMMTALRGGRRV
jgi:hypothetical protein